MVNTKTGPDNIIYKLKRWHLIFYFLVGIIFMFLLFTNIFIFAKNEFRHLLISLPAIILFGLFGYWYLRFFLKFNHNYLLKRFNVSQDTENWFQISDALEISAWINLFKKHHLFDLSVLLKMSEYYNQLSTLEKYNFFQSIKGQIIPILSLILSPLAIYCIQVQHSLDLFSQALSLAFTFAAVFVFMIFFHEFLMNSYSRKLKKISLMLLKISIYAPDKSSSGSRTTR